MELEKYKEDSYEFSKLTSDLVRQFAFAGIAIIWIFKCETPAKHLIPQELFKPLLALVLSLSFDLFQYLIPTIIWTVFFRYYENKNKGNTSIDIKASNWLSAPGWVCFFFKVLLLIYAYCLLISYLISII